MISIHEAIQSRVERIRKPNWAIPFDHLFLCIKDGKMWPFGYLYSPSNFICNGEDPCKVLIVGFGSCIERIYEPYVGPLPGSVAYEAAVDKYRGFRVETLR